MSSATLIPEPTNPDAIVPAAAPDGLAALAAVNEKPARPPGPYVLTEEDAYDHLGFSFAPLKKWGILTTIFVVQLSMNWNAAIYANAVPGLKEEFGVDDVMVRIGQMVFLVMYAFGCELWAPWSEVSRRCCLEM